MIEFTMKNGWQVRVSANRTDAGYECNAEYELFRLLTYIPASEFLSSPVFAEVVEDNIPDLHRTRA
jgi:hypothetical protein